MRSESCHKPFIRFHAGVMAACHERTGVGMDADRSLRPRNVKVHPDYTAWVEVPGMFIRIEVVDPPYWAP